MSRGLSPLALVAVGLEGDARVSIISGGTDFTAPTIWQRRGFGDICWKLVGFDDATTYTLPAAVVPFAAPRATWRYSAVIVSTQRGPRRLPLPRAGAVRVGERAAHPVGGGVRQGRADAA